MNDDAEYTRAQTGQQTFMLVKVYVSLTDNNDEGKRDELFLQLAGACRLTGGKIL